MTVRCSYQFNPVDLQSGVFSDTSHQFDWANQDRLNEAEPGRRQSATHRRPVARVHDRDRYRPVLLRRFDQLLISLVFT